MNTKPLDVFANTALLHDEQENPDTKSGGIHAGERGNFHKPFKEET